jgi:RNA polymerase sigma-70 factor (ECF subfamily)
MTVDKKIIEDCKAGKRQAQNRLYQKYAGAMLGICLRFSQSIEEAEDILQEGFIKVFSNIQNLKEDAALTSWIRRIMVNTAITHSGRKKIHFDKIEDEMVTGMEEVEDTFVPVDPEVLISIIQHLPEGYRMVLNLYVFEDYGHKEIANALGITENTSKTQLFKARKSIKKALEDLNLKSKYVVGNERRV